MATATETETRGVYPYKVERPEKASQSLLKRIDVCPFSGALYLKHKGGPQTHAMIRGELVHSVIEQLTNLMIEEGEERIPPEVAKDYAQATMLERPDLHVPNSEQEIVRICAWNWAEATVLDLSRIVAVETMFEAKVGEWTIRGRIDRAEIVDGQAHLTDYKTSLSFLTTEQFETDFQSLVYALLIAEGKPEGEETIGKGLSGVLRRQEYPRWRTEEGPLVARHAFTDRADLHDFKLTLASHLATLDHGLTEGKWLATPSPPGGYCSTCPAAQECPIDATQRPTRTIGPLSEAAEVAGHITLLDQQSKDLKKSLKAWVEENGPVPASTDHVWDLTYVKSERMTDKDALKAALTDAGTDPGEFWKTVPSTRFGVRKLTKEER